MVSPVNIALKATGVSESLHALKDVKKALIDLEKDSLRATKDASDKRLAILKSEYKQREALAKNAASVQEKVDRGTGQTAGGTTAGSRYGYGMGAAYGMLNPRYMFAHLFMQGFGQATQGGSGLFGGVAGGINNAFASANRAVLGLSLGMGALLGAVHLASSALSALGSFVLKDVVKPYFASETRLAQLANRAPAGQFDAQAAMKAAKLALIRSNMPLETSTKIMQTIGQYGGEKSWGKAVESLPFMADFIKAYGYEEQATQVTEKYAHLFKPGKSTKEVKKEFMALRRLGAEYEIPLEEMDISAFQAQTQKIQGTEWEKTMRLGTFTQLAKMGISSGPEAKTAVGNLLDVFLGMGRGKKKGPSVFGPAVKRGLAGDELDIFKALEIGYTGYLGAPDRAKWLTENIQEKRAKRGFLGPVPKIEEYIGAEKAKGVSDIEAQARGIRAFIESLKDGEKIITDENAVREEAAKIIEMTGERWNQAINRLAASIMDSGLMEKITDFVKGITTADIERFGTAIADLSNAVMSLAQWILDNITDREGAPARVAYRKLLAEGGLPSDVPVSRGSGEAAAGATGYRVPTFEEWVMGGGAESAAEKRRKEKPWHLGPFSIGGGVDWDILTGGEDPAPEKNIWNMINPINTFLPRKDKKPWGMWGPLEGLWNPSILMEGGGQAPQGGTGGDSANASNALNNSANSHMLAAKQLSAAADKIMRAAEKLNRTKSTAD